MLVWSEIPEPNTPNGSYKDCLYSTYLMGLVYGGFEDFPLGINTVAEREAFERSQTIKPYETGANLHIGDVASLHRYKVQLRKPTELLVELFKRTNSYLAVTGYNGFRCSTFHAIGVIPISATTCLVYNPLAPNNSSPTKSNITTVINWVRRGVIQGLPSEERIVTKGEFEMIAVRGTCTLLTTAGIPATTLAEVNSQIRLLTTSNTTVVPTKAVYNYFGYTVSGPNSEPCFTVVENGQVLYIIARNCFALMS